MNNIEIEELKEISRQCCELLCNYPSSLDIIDKGNNYNNVKVTKENFEAFLNRINCSNNKLDVQDFLFMSVSKIKNIFGDFIKENFPFYTNYDISFSMCYGATVTISVFYYYMGKKEHYISIISLNNQLEENVKCFEDSLMDVRKDMVSYPDNEIQQKFLREI